MKDCKYKDELQLLRETLFKSKIDYFDVNLNTQNVYYSNAIATQLGYNASEVDTMEKRNKQIHKDDIDMVMSKIDNLVNGKSDFLEMDFRIMAKDGSYIWVKNYGYIQENKITNEKHFTGILRDITYEKANLDKLDYRLMHDCLTGAYSRDFGHEKLSSLSVRGLSYAIIYFDIDNLKVVNDTYGHLAGDNLIRDFVKSLKKTMRSKDFIYRAGGDEFIGVYFDATINDLKPKKLLFDAMKQEFSYGISDSSESDDFQTVIKLADERMYQHKNEKKKK